MAASTRRISHSGHADPCCVNCNIVAVIRRRRGRPGEIPGHQQLATPRKSSPPGTAYPRPPNPVLHAMQLSPEFEPGHHTPAAPPPPPPRRQPRHEPKPPAAFRVMAGRTQLRRPRAAAVGDLHPDGADPGPHRDRDRLPGRSRAAVPDTIAEKLAHEKYSVIPAGMPRAEDRAHERADNLARSASPATFTLSRTVAPVISAPPSRPPWKTRRGRADARGFTLTSAAIVKPNAHRLR